MQINFDLTKRQGLAFSRLTDEAHRYVLYGGAKGGGKSYLLCLWAFSWAHKLAQKLKLKADEYPVALGFIGRKQGVDFKKTTLETWKKIIPYGTYTIRAHEGEIILFDGLCKLFFGGLDSTETINKFNSAELAFFAIDQAEECTREDVSVLRGALRLKHNGIQPNYKELYTANPADCWLKSDWIDESRDGYAYIPALPADNPHLPSDYIKTLEEAFRFNQPLLRAYRDGDWLGLKDSNTLINPEMIQGLRGVNVRWPDDRKIISVDPATSFDECVLMVMHNRKVIEQLILAQPDDEMRVAGEVAALARKHEIRDIAIDSIGLGAGIASRLAELDDEFNVIRINSAQSSNLPEKFANLRAEFYWQTMQAIHDKRAAYIEDEETRRQLSAVKFKVVNSSGKIQIIEKAKIKSEIGRSPDRADAYAMGIWAHDHVEPWGPRRRDRYSVDVDSELYEFNPATV